MDPAIYNNNTSCQPSSSTESPFYKIDNLEALRASKDMQSIDGWELIRRDLGYYDDNALKPEAPENAYLILYNKFTGVLRVLLKTCRGLDYNGAKITLRFDATSSFQTALLSLTDASDEGLSVTHIANPAAQSVSVYSNDNTKWFYADFPMAYDPCTCYNSSKLNIITNLIQSSSITLEGTTTGTLTTITNGAGTVNNEGKITFKDFVSGADKFQKGYTSVTSFITQSKAITDILYGAGSAQSTALTSFQTALTSSTFLKAGLAVVPWLKTAVGILDLFTGGGKSSPQPVQIMPMAVNLATKLNGSITTSNQYHNIIFSTPGSLNAAADPSIYSTYNEVLGVFNLLNNPTFITDYTVTYSGMWPTGTRTGYRLKEPIKWVVNPSSRLALQDAQVAYVAIPKVPTIAGEPTTLPVNFSENGFTISEGKDAATGKWQYRTEYVNVNCLGDDHNFNFYYPNNPQGGSPALYMKFILNFKKLDDPNGQNVLQVLTFPMQFEKRFPYPTPVPALQKFNPSACAGGRVVQASSSDINTFCQSTTYRTNRVRRTIRDSSSHLGPDKIITASVYPNPVNNELTVKFKGEVIVKDVALVNSLGQIVWSKTYNAKLKFLSIRSNKYQYGVYFLKINTPDGTLTKKVLLKQN